MARGANDKVFLAWKPAEDRFVNFIFFTEKFAKTWLEEKGVEGATLIPYTYDETRTNATDFPTDDQ